MALLLLLNIILALAVLVAVVGGLLWCIVAERDAGATGRVHQVDLRETAPLVQPAPVRA